MTPRESVIAVLVEEAEWRLDRADPDSGLHPDARAIYADDARKIVGALSVLAFCPYKSYAHLYERLDALDGRTPDRSRRVPLDDVDFSGLT